MIEKYFSYWLLIRTRTYYLPFPAINKQNLTKVKIRITDVVMSANNEIDEVPSEDEVPSDVEEPTPKRARVSSLERIKKLNSKPKEKTPAKAPKTHNQPKLNPNTGLSKHVEGKTIEQHRRGFGDVVRKALSRLK